MRDYTRRPPHEELCPSCTCDPDPPCDHAWGDGNSYTEQCLKCGMLRRMASEPYWTEAEP